MLDRQSEPDWPNQKWIAYFTYIWTAEGWLYVVAVIDLFSRRVVGRSMNANMMSQLVTDALIMAIWRRGRPDARLAKNFEKNHRRRATAWLFVASLQFLTRRAATYCIPS